MVPDELHEEALETDEEIVYLPTDTDSMMTTTDISLHKEKQQNDRDDTEGTFSDLESLLSEKSTSSQNKAWSPTAKVLSPGTTEVESRQHTTSEIEWGVPQTATSTDGHFLDDRSTAWSDSERYAHSLTGFITHSAHV